MGLKQTVNIVLLTKVPHPLSNRAPLVVWMVFIVGFLSWGFARGNRYNLGCPGLGLNSAT